MNQLMHWLAMGGYSIYIWPAYAVSLAVLLINLFAIKRAQEQTRRKLRQWFKRQ